MLDISDKTKELSQICNTLSRRIEESSVDWYYGPYVVIPKLRVKIWIQNESLKNDIALRFSVVVDDVENHFFKVLDKNVDVGKWNTDKISFIDYYVKGILLDLYFKQRPYSDDYDKEFHRLIKDEDAFYIITSSFNRK